MLIETLRTRSVILPEEEKKMCLFMAKQLKEFTDPKQTFRLQNSIKDHIKKMEELE